MLMCVSWTLKLKFSGLAQNVGLKFRGKRTNRKTELEEWWVPIGDWELWAVAIAFLPSGVMKPSGYFT